MDKRTWQTEGGEPQHEARWYGMKRTRWITGAGIVLGALAGWVYWSLWGCNEGCTITGNPINSTLYGGLLGGLLVNALRGEKRTRPANERSDHGTT